MLVSLCERELLWLIFMIRFSTFLERPHTHPPPGPSPPLIFPAEALKAQAELHPTRSLCVTCSYNSQ